MGKLYVFTMSKVVFKYFTFHIAPKSRVTQYQGGDPSQQANEIFIYSFYSLLVTGLSGLAVTQF